MESANIVYQLLRSQSCVAEPQRRKIEWAVRQAKKSSWSKKRWARPRQRWWRRRARTFDNMKFKWFPVIDVCGIDFYIDFRSRAFREVNNPHFRFAFDSQVGSKMLEEARRQGVRF